MIPRPLGSFRPAIFIDRDGVINENPPNYVRSWNDFHFLPVSLDALGALASCNWPLVIITNQSPVGRGMMTLSQLDAIHQQMLALIRRAGGRIDGIYICPHTPEEGCACRKPRPGLLLQAAQEMHLDLHASIFIGDSLSDVQAALAAGVTPVLLRNGGFAHAAGNASNADPTETIIFDDLAAVARLFQDPCKVSTPRAVIQLALRKNCSQQKGENAHDDF